MSLPLLAIIKNLITKTQSGIRSGFHLNELFLTKNGVVQRGVLSPFLYGVFINDLFTKLDNSKKVIPIFNHHMPAVLYCDDITLLATNHTQ